MQENAVNLTPAVRAVDGRRAGRLPPQARFLTTDRRAFLPASEAPRPSGRPWPGGRVRRKVERRQVERHQRAHRPARPRAHQPDPRTDAAHQLLLARRRPPARGSAGIRLCEGAPRDEPGVGHPRRRVPGVAGVPGRGGGADGHPPSAHRARPRPCSTGASPPMFRSSRFSPRPTSSPAGAAAPRCPRCAGASPVAATRRVRSRSRRRSRSDAGSSRTVWTAGSGLARICYRFAPVP